MSADPTAVMPWKLLFLTIAFGAGLVYFGYGPDEFRRAATDLSHTTSDNVAPSGSDKSDWGS